MHSALDCVEILPDIFMIWASLES